MKLPSSAEPPARTDATWDPVPGDVVERHGTRRIVAHPAWWLQGTGDMVSWVVASTELRERGTCTIGQWRRWGRTKPRARVVQDHDVDETLRALGIGPAELAPGLARVRAAVQLRAARASVAGAILALALDRARERSPMPDPMADPGGYEEEMARDRARNHGPPVLSKPLDDVDPETIDAELDAAGGLFPDLDTRSDRERLSHFASRLGKLSRDKAARLRAADDERREDPGRQPKVRAGGIITTTLALDWQTPEEYLRPVRAVLTGDPALPIPLDVATAPNNPTGALRFYAPPESDGLSMPWDAPWFCNPPYGNQIRAWFGRLLDQVRNGAPGLLFIPNSRTEMPYLHDVIRAAEAQCLVRGRVAFRRPETGDRPRGNVGGSIFLGYNLDPAIMAVEMSPGCRTSCRPKRGRRRKLAPAGPLFGEPVSAEPEDTRPEGDWFGGLVLALEPADGGPRLQLPECVTCGDMPCTGRADPRSIPHPDGPCCACCRVLAPPEFAERDQTGALRFGAAAKVLRAGSCAGLLHISTATGAEAQRCPSCEGWLDPAALAGGFVEMRSQESGVLLGVAGVDLGCEVPPPIGRVLLAPCGCHVVSYQDQAGRTLETVEHRQGCAAMETVTAGPEGRPTVRLPGPEAMHGYADQFGGSDFP